MHCFLGFWCSSSYHWLWQSSQLVFEFLTVSGIMPYLIASEADIKINQSQRLASFVYRQWAPFPSLWQLACLWLYQTCRGPAFTFVSFGGSEGI